MEVSVFFFFFFNDCCEDFVFQKKCGSLFIHQNILFVYCDPISREPNSWLMEWEASNKSFSSSPAWASEMLTTQPAQCLSTSFWPLMSDSWITDNFPKYMSWGRCTIKKKPLQTRQIDFLDIRLKTVQYDQRYLKKQKKRIWCLRSLSKEKLSVLEK